MSRTSVVEEYVDSRLRLIEGLSIKLLPPGSLGLLGPDSYPGLTHGLDASPVIEKRPHARRYWRKRQVNGWVLIYGTSDGVETGDARHNAWTWLDAIEGALDGMKPPSSAMPAESADESSTTVTHIETGTAEPFISDVGLFGVAVPWSLTYSYETNRENE